MRPSGPGKMDVRTAWNAWTAGDSPNAAAEFLDRVEAWTEGTAAQLAREARHLCAAPVSRDEVADRLRHHLGVVAEGETVTYVEALEQARREVIEELRGRSAI